MKKIGHERTNTVIPFIRHICLFVQCWFWEMRSVFLMGTEFYLRMKKFWRWLHSGVNAPNATELHTLKWLTGNVYIRHIQPQSNFLKRKREDGLQGTSTLQQGRHPLWRSCLCCSLWCAGARRMFSEVSLMPPSLLSSCQSPTEHLLPADAEHRSWEGMKVLCKAYVTREKLHELRLL